MDDEVLYLANPIKSLQEIQLLLDMFGGVSRLRVNVSNSELYPIYISNEPKERITLEFQYIWVTGIWRSLRISVPLNLDDLCNINFGVLHESIKRLFTQWSKYNFSWLEHIDIVKLFILPTFL